MVSNMAKIPWFQINCTNKPELYYINSKEENEQQGRNQGYLTIISNMLKAY